MIFGGPCQTIRWVGNEQGWAGDTDWCMINPESSDDTKHLNHGSENGTLSFSALGEKEVIMVYSFISSVSKTPPAELSV